MSNQTGLFWHFEQDVTLKSKFLFRQWFEVSFAFVSSVYRCIVSTWVYSRLTAIVEAWQWIVQNAFNPNYMKYQPSDGSTCCPVSPLPLPLLLLPSPSRGVPLRFPNPPPPSAGQIVLIFLHYFKFHPFSDNCLTFYPIPSVYGPIRTRSYFVKLIDRCVNHKLSRMRTDDTFGRARQTSKVRTACLWGAPFSTALDHILFLFPGQLIHETKSKYGLVAINTKSLKVSFEENLHLFPIWWEKKKVL